MSLWTKSSGIKLATLQERQTTTVSLPLSDLSAVTTFISGSLPDGMRLSGNQLVGTPYQVPRDTNYKFVIRATLGPILEDRTFVIEVQGPDKPVWITEEDLLPVGLEGQYFILDSAPVDFQLEVIDADTSAGQTLEYWIGSRDGELPPGVQLTRDGRLVGIVDPILSLEKDINTGEYDTGPYDAQGKTPFDFAVRPNNGYDSYFYDITLYGLSVPTKTPKKLNRFYQFTVSVSDGDTIEKRTFRIYVVGDDFFRSDTTIMQVGTGIFTADVTNLRTPIWITPRDFGYRRANNYITLVLDIIDPNTLTGLVAYNLESKNDDGSDSELPPGLALDTITGEIAGYTPYQPAVTKEYKFTVNARRFEIDQENIQFLQFVFEDTPVNSLNLKLNKLGEHANRAVGQNFNIDGFAYKVQSINTTNSEFDTVVLDKVLHKTLTKGTSIDLGTVSITSTEIAEKAKTFTIKLLGEVDSVIRWLTPENLGSISSNYVSTLAVQAETTVPNARLIYTLESGTLPPGISLSYDGELIGKINSFGTSDKPGLTVFDNQQLLLDANTTSIDRNFKFTIKAQDQFGYSAIQRQFNIVVSDPDDKLYSNIFAKPFLKESSRVEFSNIVNNPDVFLPEYIYRPNDPNFGLQTEIKMLMYAGIETKEISHYVAAAAKNHKRKKFIIGDVKTAVAKTPGTNDIVYEVVYLEVIDPYESKNGDVKKKINVVNSKQLINQVKYTVEDELYDSDPATLKITTRAEGEVDLTFYKALPILTRSGIVNYQVGSTFDVILQDNSVVSATLIPGKPKTMKLRPTPANVITVDSDAITIDGGNDVVRYISNISHMRDAIKELGETEKNYLPLWMRTPQTGSVNELGFVNAIPLVYCKPGKANIIKNTIDYLDIDFAQFNMDIDRYIIDSTTGNSEEQYIVFANYKFNI